jgi:hypothetical protein
MATIGVNYKDSGTGTDIAKILMQAVVGDPDAAATYAKTEAALMGAKIDRERTQALARYEKEKAAREQGIYNYAESSIDPATELAMDSYNRFSAPTEAPVPVRLDDSYAPTPQQNADLAAAQAAANAGYTPTGTTLQVDPARDPAIAHWLPPELQPAVMPDDYGPLPIEGDGPVPLNGGPTYTSSQLVAPMNIPVGAASDPAISALPEPPVPIDDGPVVPSPAGGSTLARRPLPGGATDNGTSITTPEGHTLSKAQVRSLVAVAAHSDDPYGSLRKLTGQLGLTYGDTPEELKTAMIMLGEDARHLPTSMGGDGSETKQSDIKGMRGEVTKAREMLTTVEPLYKSLETSLDRTDHVSDLDFIYGIATILDPGSVVRETDAVQIARAAGLAPELIGRINAVNGGASLDKPTRLKLMALAKSRMGGYRDVFDKTARDYVERAKRNKWDPLDVVSQEDLDRLANPARPDAVPGAPPAGSGFTQAQWDALTPAEQQEVIDEQAGGTP